LSLAYLEELPWMKINYDKNDLMIIGLDDSLVNDLAGPFLSKKGVISFQIFSSAYALCKN
jgi:hypothetical protein